MEIEEEWLGALERIGEGTGGEKEKTVIGI